MKKLLSPLSILFISNYLLAQVPGNNDCINATPITTDSTCVTGTSRLTGQTLLNATVEGAGIASCGTTLSQDVWYTFLARTQFPTITASSEGSSWGSSGANMRIQLLSGTGICGTLNSVACANGLSLTPAITNPLTPGTLYYIRIHKNNATVPTGANWGFTICVTDPLEKGNRMNEIFVQTVLSGPGVLQYPWEVTYGPDDSLWVTESKEYKVYKVSANTGVKRMVLDISQGSTFLPAAERTPFNCQFANGAGAQGGLAGLALHPDFLSGNNSVYISYIYSGSGSFFTNKLVMFTYDAATGLLKNPVALCDTLPGSNDHNSQRMIIAPITPGGTKYLFYASGDMGAGQGNATNIARQIKAQFPNSYEGKILRFNLVSDGDPVVPVTNYLDEWVPSSAGDPNLYNTMLGKQSAVWSIGMRNNQGFAYDADLNILYGTSHGAYSDDELNIIEGFKNYGHPLIMGYVADGNYDGDTSVPSTRYGAGAPFPTVGTGYSSCPPISSEASRKIAIDASGNGLYKDPVFSAYPGPAGTGAGTPRNIWTNNPSPPGNAAWPSEGWSGIGLYTDKMIPGWYKSIIAGGLKWGRLIKLKLGLTGNTTMPSNLGGVGNSGDTVTYFQSVNRYRDIAFGPNGKDIYVVMDNNAATSGPGTNNPIVAACPGCVIKYSFLGYAAATAAPGLSLIPKTIDVTNGTVNTCNTGTTVTIDGSNNFLWVPITGPDGNIMAEINANGNNLGTVISSFYKHSGTIRIAGGKRYLNRNITITPQFQPTLPSGNPLVKIRLYISKAEFDALDADALSGISTITDLKILKNADLCGSAILSNTLPAITPVNTTVTNVAADYQHGPGNNGYVLQGDISSFSSFYFGSANITLPVGLIVFNGSLQPNGSALLNWKTANEQNSSHFIIERSADGNNFNTIGRVAASGNTTVTTNYPYTDNDAAIQQQPQLYYRLKIVDNNGEFGYSNIVIISFASLTKITVYPIPAHNSINVNIQAAASGDAQLQVIDNSGHIVLHNTATLLKGSNDLNINLQKLGAGPYYLKVTGNGFDKKVKIQKL
jgi:glucose/arabinose dehydrogenase